MTTRLDRLLLLLSTGSTQIVRQTAAKQLGHIAAQCIARPSTSSAGGSGSSGTSGGSDAYHGLDGQWADVVNLLVKVLPFLRSKQWETRTAAASAIEAIVRAAGIWEPPDYAIETTDDYTPSNGSIPIPSALASFDINDIILNTNQLLASSGAEYSGAAQGSLGKKELVKSLGLSVPGAGDDEIGIDVEEELRNGAQQQQQDTSNGLSGDVKGKGKSASPAIANSADGDIDLSKLSARERNAIKRKRKLAGNGSSALNEPPPAKSRKLDGLNQSANSSRTATPPYNTMPVKQEDTEDVKSQDTVVVAYKGPQGGQATVKDAEKEQATWIPGPEEWPFTHILASMQDNLLSADWEIRHGAALGIREILKVQGRAAGTIAGFSRWENAQQHREWASDLATSLLTVLARDRFGDFVGDQVVAPVRETAAQTLSALIVHMPKVSVLEVYAHLTTMVRQEEVKAALEAQAKLDPESRQGKRNYYWEVKHAGLLGLKYLAAVHRDLFSGMKSEEPNQGMLNGSFAVQSNSNKLVDDILATAILGLGDRDDDVRSVAASLLLPIAANIVDCTTSDRLLELLDMIYLSLNDLRDDLSSSVGNVMDLLSKLLTFPQVLDQVQASGESRSLQVLVPRLFPFFRHTIVGVRKAVVEAINTFLSLPRASHKGWLDERLLRLLYQNLIVEQQADIRSSTAIAWNAAIQALPDATISNTVQPYLAAWFDILMTPIGQALNIAHFWKPSEYDANASGAYNVDKAMVKQDLALVTVEAVVQCRLASMAALASLFARSRSSMEIMYGPLVSVYLTSASSHQISFANYLLASGLARQGEAQGESAFLAEVRQLVLRGLSSEAAVSYSETAGLLSQIHTQCQQLYGIAKNKGRLPASIIPVLDPPQQGFSLARAQQVINTENLALQNAMKPTNRGAAKALMDELSAKIAVEVARTAAIKESMDIQVFAALAGATVALKQIPGKLNPLIRSLMNGIKFELNLDLQARTADVLADFLLLCEERAATLKANPSDKIVKNVCSFLCQDQTLTPLFTQWKTSTKSILTRSDFIDVDLAQLTTVQPRRGPKSGNQPIEDTETDEQRKTRIVRRGAELCLRSLTARFGDDLFRRVAMLWHAASHALVNATKDGLESFDIICSSNDSLSQEVMDCLTVLEAIVAQSPPGLPDAVAPLTGNVLIALQSKYAVIRYVAVRCMSTLCNILTEHTMKILVINVLPFIADPKSVARRRGAVQLLADIVDRLDIRILPYIIFLVVPILGRMTDPDEEVRSLATRTFALMVKLVPLEADIPDPIGFPGDLLQKREDERRFLSQLLGGGKVEEYQLPIKISVDLRRYQRDGVSWLAFLARYQLHGILCDDMGLGKTLQTICILGSKTLERAQAHAAEKSPSTVHLPSLVVCPPTLTNHWRHEIHQYAPDLTCTIYGGDRQERLQRAASLNRYDIVVMSYDVVRNDIDALGRIQWHYCVLDEGHIIKNGKTKLSKAIKTIQANHRLILSGTPIQNNVLELWNLFDFLMPGFLGTEESFNRRYGKPIQQSRDAKSSSKEQEAGALALDALHKQVLPFVLRRLKEDVLDDLPPKIIQDYYCELSPLQRDLYESFAKAGAGGEPEDNLRDDEEAALPNGAGDGQNTHVFQTLQYLRRLVNHPTLVIRPEQENHRRILAKHGFKGENDRNLRDISQAPKLMALKQLLLDNGIGVQSAKGEPDDAGPLNGGDGDAVAPHRVLIFCQLKNMLDLIQNSLFAEHMPSVSYMRLDGSTPPHKRHDVVQTFNADPSIDVLLLTTHVGGLGLNLTGADTVIFVEHDWNPMRDLQAMDRAHRLGQKRVVNVYRLITRGTLEEKIMGLQRFKMNIASTVVSQQNSDISDMGTDNVLDLFSGAANGDQNDSGEGTKKQGKLSQKEMLQSLQELDDPSDDYKDLGDASRFADTLNS